MSQITMLHDNAIDFPPVDFALTQPDGLLAVGGDLSSARLTAAYQQGIFPWFNEGEPLMWWSPSERCVLFCDQFKTNKTFKKFIKKQLFRVTINRNFNAVIHHCRLPRKNEAGTWIDDNMNTAYNKLHLEKHAHSVEVWRNDRLVGGLYGIFINNTFCGESMFSLEPNASKTALYALCQFLLQHNVTVIDCQIENPHLMSLGASVISRQQFISHLALHQTTDSHDINSCPIDWCTKELSYG